VPALRIIGATFAEKFIVAFLDFGDSCLNDDCCRYLHDHTFSIAKRAPVGIVLERGFNVTGLTDDATLRLSLESLFGFDIRLVHHEHFVRHVRGHDGERLTIRANPDQFKLIACQVRLRNPRTVPSVLF